MGSRGATLLVLGSLIALGGDAYAQAVAPPAVRRQAAPPAARAPVKPAPGSPAAVYARMPEEERITIQRDLIWTDDYNGMATGDFGEASVAAVKSFQKHNAGKETGILNTDERLRLAQAARARQQRVGWQEVEDRATGARLGVPMKLVPQARAAGSGNHWQSAHGEIQVHTFRMAGPGVTLAKVFDQQKKEPAQRKVEYNVMRDGFFVISGLQNLKKFYVRAHVKGEEVRGMTVLYDQAMEGIMDAVTVAMSNAFQPFPESVAGAAGPKSKVEYASGVVVSAAGDIVTDAGAVEACEYILVPGRGRAETLGRDGGLALLRVYGARGLMPLALAANAAGGANLVLVGVADPQAQGGRGDVSTAPARRAAGADSKSLSPPPAPGFSGAAALDPDNGVVGIVVARPQKVAGPASEGAAWLIPAEAVRSLLAKHKVAAASGRASLEAAKAGIVRVVCVRE
jgi:peptidoglycan hydrolase-like protein with peptidoglycan-binding domain